MHSIIALDKQLFHFINSTCANPFLDWLAPVIRNPITWAPLYLFLIVFVLVNACKNKLLWILFVIALAVLANYISSDLIKNNIWRVRPCNDPELAGKMRFLLNYRPISSSFTSSHAVNHFALAAFFYYTLKMFLGKWALLFWFWAFIIIFCQVYVGVHYPLDVICGAVIGFILGYLPARLFNTKCGFR
ncbi:MAG: hypothetical protein ABS68_09465 [Niastella sp. SCN 39-18]|nr:phosphatase PAP2 family protein [Sphingobacteriales bacterium]ODT52324.1 MAG: hypothetical protein ABS68_09465 [Niastella sp. SCN 39-18]OJW10402.1 MAG: hypothetical protein BGO53_09425 [Sphingobacteriales bacterium 39-19]